MRNSIFIPKRINVGYQNRSDTYTGKLAYIIYYDEKNKLRKETSWNNWRDHKIQNEEFDNTPTEGFVLNKHAGGVQNSWGWDARKSYCRVYDPRGFEFEITIENLLYILENANCIKGKGLEGDFVYGWDGKDLVLMPIESPDYKQISEFSYVINGNNTIKTKDLIVGATYLTKDNKKWIYMGRFDSHSSGKGYDYNKGKHFVFWAGWDFVWYKNIPKIIKCIDHKCSEEYSKLFYELEGCARYSPYDNTKNEYQYLTLDEFKDRVSGKWWNTRCFISEYYNGCKDSFIVWEQENEKYTLGRKVMHKTTYGVTYQYDEVIDIFPTISKKVRSYIHPYKDTEEKKMIPVSIEEIFKTMKPMYVQKYLMNGREFKKEYMLNE